MKPKIPARFRPVEDVALVTERPRHTIYNWAAAGHIDKIKLRDGTVLVDLVAAKRRSDATPRRNRQRTAA